MNPNSTKLRLIGCAGIYRCRQHLRDVVDDVLSTAEIASGKVPTDVEPIEIGAAINSVVDLLHATATSAGTHFVVNFEVSEKVHVMADPRRLRQVMLNLLSNAVKYNAENSTVEIDVCAADNGFVRVRVTDHGLGMDPAQLSRLFVAFDRLGVENSSIPGTGLGLVVAKAMVEAMGGKIGADSQTNQGSTFWIDLIRATQ